MSIIIQNGSVENASNILQPQPQRVEGSRVVVLVPAHNEEALIADTVASLFAQTRCPDRILVVADNCTDRTPELATAAGAEVFFTQNNRDKKAGGLNQALA